MSLSQQAGFWGLRAVGTLNREGVADGSATVGKTGAQKVALTSADVVYAFKVTRNASGDAAQLTWTTGQVTASAGSPTIEDEGVDYEGETLPTMDTIYGVAVVAGSANVGKATAANSEATFPDWNVDDDEVAQWLCPNGRTAAGTLTITPGSDGDTVTVYVLAGAA